MTLRQKTMFENATISQIEVCDAWPVSIVADSCTYVEVYYSAYLENYLKITMEDTKLRIGFTGWVSTASGAVFKAIIHTNQLELLEVEDASKVQCSGTFSGPKLKIEMNDAAYCNGLVFSGSECEIDMGDASVLTDFHFLGNTCEAELEGASQFNGQIEASEQLEVILKDASRFVNKGDVNGMVFINLQSSSLLNMVETQIEAMQVELSGASEASVNVSNQIEGFLMEASTLYYKGHPQLNVNCSEDSKIIPL